MLQQGSDVGAIETPVHLADRPPLALTAAIKGRSLVDRSISVNGGDWLKTSGVANAGCVMAVPCS